MCKNGRIWRWVDHTVGHSTLRSLVVGILGHEFVGKVVEVDADAGVSVGQRVVGEINVACNSCAACSRGGVVRRNHCANRSVLGIVAKDGTFAEYLTLPAGNLFAVPDSVSDGAAAFAEPLAAAFRIAEQNVVRPGDRVAVIGDGKLGLLICQVVRTLLTDGHLVAFGKHKDKLALLPTNIETKVVDADTGARYRDTFDVCVEASGSPQGLMLAESLTRPLGTIVLKTTCAVNDPHFNMAPLVIKEMTLVGSRCGNFPMALRALAAGEVSVDKLLTAVYPLEKADEAVAHAARKGTLKIQLSVSDQSWSCIM